MQGWLIPYYLYTRNAAEPDFRLIPVLNRNRLIRGSGFGPDPDPEPAASLMYLYTYEYVRI